ncbi:MAG: acyltransferase [Bacteroidetes bacterium]|nr:acyltransferase [Bacteroidota bacterium]
MMTSTNPLFPLIVYLIAFLSAYLINLKVKLNTAPGRFETIDGLRGFLALGVFIHHSCVWQKYSQTGLWEGPSTYLMIHFGQSCVIFFFMITSFLFVSKLLASKNTDFNWRAFFISRIFRLVPMYYTSLLIIILFILIKSHWNIHVSGDVFFKSIVNWGMFTIYKTPVINDYWVVLINAGVEWSLPYEWLFYFSLPIIAIFILKTKPKIIYGLISLFFIVFFCVFHEVVPYYLYAFIGGGIAPFLLKYTTLAQKVKNIYADIIILICLVLIIQFETAKNIYCIGITTLAFTLIALGNSLFGVLKNKQMKFLGDICYTTYLLHGLILFSVFDLIIGMDVSKGFSATTYCIIIFCTTPFVVLISLIGFKFVEKPFMDLAKKINRS